MTKHDHWCTCTLCIVARSKRAEPDPRPYHERRRDLPHCPECLDPDCRSLVCDEAECT